VNARSCKPIKSLLGEAYENARLAMKNIVGAAAAREKTSAKKAPARQESPGKEGDREAYEGGRGCRGG
jgi:DNA ligase-1